MWIGNKVLWFLAGPYIDSLGAGMPTESAKTVDSSSYYNSLYRFLLLVGEYDPELCTCEVTGEPFRVKEACYISPSIEYLE